MAVLLVAASAVQSISSAKAADPRKATTSREARQEATRAIPLEKVEPRDRPAVQFVLENTSLFRRLPVQVIDCDPNLYVFLLRHPEVITNIWQVMGISAVSLERTGPDTFRASDGEGTVCGIKIVHTAHDKYVIYAEGSYNGPLFKRPIVARCVALLRSGYIRETNGRHYVTCQLDTFLHVERGGVQLLAKTFQPLLGRAADYNFSETMAFVSGLSHTAEVNPQGTRRMAHRLEKVDGETREQLVALTDQLAKRAENEKAPPRKPEKRPPVVRQSSAQVEPPLRR